MVKIKVENLDKEVRLDAHVLQKKGGGDEIMSTQLVGPGDNWTAELDASTSQVLRLTPMYGEPKEKPAEEVKPETADVKPPAPQMPPAKK